MGSYVHQLCVCVSAVFANVLLLSVCSAAFQKQAIRYATSSTNMEILQHSESAASSWPEAEIEGWKCVLARKSVFCPVFPLSHSFAQPPCSSCFLPACRLSPSCFAFMYYVCLDSCLSNDGKTIIPPGSCLLVLFLGRSPSNGTPWGAEGGGCSHCRAWGAACPLAWLQRFQSVEQPLFGLF